MSVYGRQRFYDPRGERLIISAQEWAKLSAAEQEQVRQSLRRGYSDVDVIEMVEVKGVWMTPEDARRAA